MRTGPAVAITPHTCRATSSDNCGRAAADVVLRAATIPGATTLREQAECLTGVGRVGFEACRYLRLLPPSYKKL